MTDQTQTSVSAVIENDSTSQAGLFTRVDDTRNIRGLLLPFGELSRPSSNGVEPIEFSAASVKLPRDPSVVTLNVEHDRFNPIGRALSLELTPAGVVAEFAIADTDEGDAYLANPVRKLSAEVTGIVRDGARALASRLTGAAVCAAGAFASAGLFSIAPDDENAERVVTAEELADLRARIQEIEDALSGASDDLDLPTSEEPDSEEPTPPSAPDEDPTDEQEFNMSDAVTEVAGAVVPATLLASAPTGKSSDVDLSAVFSAMAAVKNGTSAQTADAESMLAALSDIKAEATGGLTTAGSGVIPPSFAGKLWQGKRYQSRYIDLANHQYGGISLGGRKGFKLAQGTALVAEVANAAQKVELPSGTATTSVFSSSIRKFGYAADIALEWSYLDGGADVLQAFWEGVVDSYAKVVDESALKDIFTVASKTSTALDRLIAPNTYPTQYPAAMGQLIQGIEAVSDNNDDASFAIVNPVAWTQLLFTPKDLVPEFVEFSVGIGTGEASTGKVRVVKAPQSFFTGTVATAPQVIVGAKNAIEFREQGTTPIQIDALEVAKFGVDRALVGFLETFIVRPESLALIGTKP